MKIKYLVATLICLFPGIGRAELQIDVVGAMSNPLPIAYPDILGGERTQTIANDIKSVVTADLHSTGLFKVIPERSYIQSFKTINDQPIFVDWQAIKSHALIQSSISEVDPETVKVDIKIWDIPAERQLFTQTFTTRKSNWRRTAHKIADKIYERLTGEKGYFDTRVVYVSEAGPATNRVKRLAIMDQDGENHRFLTTGNAMALTPRFSPNMQKITYLSYSGSVPKVYTLDINTGRQELVGHFPGMTFAPSFSPDSRKMVFSYANNGNSEIFELDLTTKETRQLTNHPAIDTSPSYSPDGKKIVFNSDRGGNQQLYVMNVDGSGVERISFGNGRYATPAWSPRGDYIAFTKMANGQFYIGVMYPDGSGERVIASGYLVEAPVWAPNGRVLMYFRQEKGGVMRNASVNLFTIDITGYNERKVVTPAEASDPAWSPLLD